MLRRLRTQDVLFGLLCTAVIVLWALRLPVIVFALAGAFVCGAFYVFIGMMPDRSEAFWRRLFTTVFLAVVGSCLVVALAGTLGPRMRHHGPEELVLAIAALLPLSAACFEIARTPDLIQAILHRFRSR